jgi:hypothetical protein
MNTETSVSKIVDLVFKAVALAMAVAVVVTSILGVTDVEARMLMLGLSLFCLAVTALDKSDTR